MSTLFNIRIELVVGSTVWARFQVRHPDQWEVPATKSIALLVVVETYDDRKHAFGISAGQSMSRAEAAHRTATHPNQAKLEQLLEIYKRFDGPAFAAEADESILDVELTNEEGNPRQEEGGPDPRAMLVFTVKDPALIAHLEGGWSFESAMCDCCLW